MDNLTFEFMERTKNIPTPTLTVQSLYRLKSFLVFVWVLFGGLYTSFIFTAQCLLFFAVGILLMISISTPRRPFGHRWEQIYALAVIYCFLPFGSSPVIYVVCAATAILVMEFFFIRFNGYFINIAVFVLCFAVMIFPEDFLTTKLQPFLFFPEDIFFFLSSFPTYMGGGFFHKDLPSLLLGLFPYSPAAILGLLGLLTYILPFVPRLIYRSSFSYILGICFFSSIGYYLMRYYGHYEPSYGHFLKNLFSRSSIVFTALFIIPETLGNPMLSRNPFIFAMMNAFFTVLCYIFLPFFLLSSLIGFLLSFLFYYLMDKSWLSNKVVGE